MPYDEKYKDEDFINALGNGWKYTKTVGLDVKCSYEEAKHRLRILEKEERVKGRKEIGGGGSENFKWEWKANKNYKEPIMKPEGMGLHFFDRGISFEKIRFEKFANACKAIAEASGTVFVDGIESEFSDNKIYINNPTTSDNLFKITRIIESTLRAMKSDDKGRYYEFAYTYDQPYNLVAVSCLITLKQLFPKVKLSLGVDNKTFDEAIELVDSIDSKITGIKKVNRKKLLNDVREINRKELLTRAI